MRTKDHIVNGYKTFLYVLGYLFAMLIAVGIIIIVCVWAEAARLWLALKWLGW